MGGQGKWKAREGRNRDKTSCCGNQSILHPHSSIPTPSLYSSVCRSYPVLSEVGRETIRHFYASLRSIALSLRNLEHCVQEIP